MKDWRRNVEQGVYGKVKCIEGQGTCYMFEHRTHSTQVFQEGVLGSVVREAGQDHRLQQRFRVQYVKRSERPVPSFFLPPSLGSWAFLTQLKLQKVPCHHPV